MEDEEEKNQQWSTTWFSLRSVINWWSKVDDDVVCATSVNAFKNRLQRIWEKDEFVFGPQSNKRRRSNQPVTGMASSGKHRRGHFRSRDKDPP